MIRRKLFLIPFLQLVWLTIASIPASAEWFADLYVGPAITQNEDVRFKLLPPFSPKFTLNNMSFDTSVSFGGRFGHWFESFPYLGLGLDVFHFSPDLSSQRVHVCGPVGCFTDPNIHFDLAATSISFDAMLRWPLLTSKDFPKGQLQPYLTIGPAIFIARGKDLVATGGPATRSDTDISVGAKTGAGLAWQVHPNVALFGEYRFTHFNPHFSAGDVFIPGIKDEVETKVNTHHVLFGISLRF